MYTKESSIAALYMLTREKSRWWSKWLYREFLKPLIISTYTNRQSNFSLIHGENRRNTECFSILSYFPHNPVFNLWKRWLNQRVRIGGQIFRSSRAKAEGILGVFRGFRNADERKICRQGVRGDLISVSLYVYGQPSHRRMR